MAMSFKDRVEYLISAVRAQNAALDTSPVSPIRVLINAVAEMGAQADLAVDRSYNWDISTKSGRDLDNFVELFGFSRIPAKHARGFVTLKFAINTTRDYILPRGTVFVSGTGLNRGRYRYISSEQIGIPRFSSYVNVPIQAEIPGSTYNVRSGEIGIMNFSLEQLVNVINENPITGGEDQETDTDLRNRFRANLFRNNLGNESWYKSIAERHPNVVSTQVIRPSQETEEHLKIVNNKANSVEDSLKYTFPGTFSVYLPRTNEFLEENKDYIVLIDNDTPLPPSIEFIGNRHQDGDSVTIRYRYSSTVSRNNPLTGNMHYLDLYVAGNQPASFIDFSVWPNDKIFGNGTVNESTHPDGILGKQYYVFTRQPVVDVPSEMTVRGKKYFRNRDYILVKDKTVNGNSTRAKDILIWKTILPIGEPVPSFHFPYFHDAIVSTIQEGIDLPDMHTAVDDVLVHSANIIPFDFDLVIEWERGIENAAAVEDEIKRHLSTIAMGSRIRIGPLMRSLQNVNRVAAVFIGEKCITSSVNIRGRNTWKFDIPLPDGSVPRLNNVTITTTASNIY